MSLYRIYGLYFYLDIIKKYRISILLLVLLCMERLLMNYTQGIK